MSDSLFTPRPIGFARTPFHDTSEIPKGPGTRHQAYGQTENLPEPGDGRHGDEGVCQPCGAWSGRGVGWAGVALGGGWAGVGVDDIPR